MDKPRQKCSACYRTFIDLCGLRKHVRIFHPDKLNVLAPLKLVHKDGNNKCKLCSSSFALMRSLRSHIRRKHPEHMQSNKYFLKRKCPICQACDKPERNYMLNHFRDVHKICIKSQDLEFSSLEDFHKWKVSMEKESLSRFVKEYGTRYSSDFVCHRSGFFKSRSKGLRVLKSQGSNKINGFCPAGIKLVVKEGKCTVRYVETHVGHKTDLEHLTLTSVERKQIAEKLVSAVPFDEILNETRGTLTSSKIERIHILSRKDLHNIEKCFKLPSSTAKQPADEQTTNEQAADEQAVDEQAADEQAAEEQASDEQSADEQSTDETSFDLLVNKMRKHDDCILYYKPQNTLCIEHPYLKDDDFVLIIMTGAQRDKLKEYGNDCVCVDWISRLSYYKFKLHTILVIDEMRQGFPCAFFISNRRDMAVWILFFTYVKNKVGNLKPQVFMSDLGDIYFHAWLEVMGEPILRLYCSWHLDRVWRRNMQIERKDKRIAVYKQLRTILEEKDIGVFLEMTKSFFKKFDADPDTSAFACYFRDVYMPISKYWANCYILHAGFCTSKYVERMHRTIKYISVQNGMRLDSCITALMKFIREKLYDRSMVNDEVNTTLTNIRSRHQKSLNLNRNEIVENDGNWTIPSTTEKVDEAGDNSEIASTIATNFIRHTVEKINIDCSCQLVCDHCCGVCVHQYSCTCVDSALKWNMCEHIHAVCCKLLENQPRIEIEYLDDDSDGDIDEVSDGDIDEVSDGDIDEVSDGDIDEVSDGDINEVSDRVDGDIDEVSDGVDGDNDEVIYLVVEDIDDDTVRDNDEDNGKSFEEEKEKLKAYLCETVDKFQTNSELQIFKEIFASIPTD